MLRYEYEQTMWQEYTATVLWSLGKMLAREDYPLPSYDDFMHPKPKDRRTTEQIVSGLTAKLLAGGESA